MDKVSKICILCRKEMKSPFDEFNASTVKSHYTFCYIAEGRFSGILSERKVSLTEEERKYYCPECPVVYRRRLYGKEYAFHMGVNHGKTRDIMAEDKRPGMGHIFEFCFPSNESPKVAQYVPKRNIAVKSCSRDVPTRTNTMVNSGSQQVPSRKIIVNNSRSVSDGKVSSISVENKGHSLFSLFSDRPVAPTEEEIVDDPGAPTEEEESVDDPGALPSPPPAKRIKMEPHQMTESSKPVLVRKCVLCEKKQFNITPGNPREIRDMMFHYATCIFDRIEMNEMKKVSRGPDNEDDDMGKRFTYKCPIPECPDFSEKPHSKGITFKAYFIHFLVNHGQLEKALERIAIPGIETVREAVLHHRKKKLREEVLVDEMPEAKIEELHDCFICERRDQPGNGGKKLILSKAKIQQHYKECYFSTQPDVIMKMYPPGEDNLDGNGKIKDDVGKHKWSKYRCDVPKCKYKESGYRAFCYHKMTDHGGLLELLEKDITLGARRVFDKFRSMT